MWDSTLVAAVTLIVILQAASVRAGKKLQYPRDAVSPQRMMLRFIKVLLSAVTPVDEFEDTGQKLD